MTFDAFVGVDWSGAKGSRHRTIQVAMCEPGDGAPRIVPAPGGAWSRRGVLDWMLDAEHQGRVLAGFDFSFTVPFVDRGAYFPGSRRSLPTARDLWMEVDRVSADGDDFYAGAFVDTQPFAAHFQTPRAIGARFSRRHKVVERACVTQGLGWPETVFHLIGPKQVGLGSLAGMRFLAALRREAPKFVFGLSTRSRRADPRLSRCFRGFFWRLAGRAWPKCGQPNPSTKCWPAMALDLRRPQGCWTTM